MESQYVTSGQAAASGSVGAASIPSAAPAGTGTKRSQKASKKAADKKPSTAAAAASAAAAQQAALQEQHAQEQLKVSRAPLTGTRNFNQQKT